MDLKTITMSERNQKRPHPANPSIHTKKRVYMVRLNICSILENAN